MKHSLHQCDDEDCPVCLGGLAWCTVCGGGEASLPSECPGRKMTDAEEDAVQDGRLDFVIVDFGRGEWVDPEPGWPEKVL